MSFQIFDDSKLVPKSLPETGDPCSQLFEENKKKVLKWYPAKVHRVYADGRFCVIFGDGSIERDLWPWDPSVTFLDEQDEVR